MHNIYYTTKLDVIIQCELYYTTKLDVIIQCELGREPGGQTSLPDNNLGLVSVILLSC